MYKYIYNASLESFINLGPDIQGGREDTNVLKAAEKCLCFSSRIKSGNFLNGTKIRSESKKRMNL